jgi:23S rRNA pseudouridine2605 synthase
MSEKSKTADNVNNPDRGERIAKVLARLGVCSRRDAERLIEERRVKLNGSLVTSPATFIAPGDSLSVDDVKVGEKQIPRLFLYHKPPGQITTAKDPQGRPTVFDALPKTLPRLISIGRLDLNTEGLLLLTNDGDLSRTLELPSTAWVRTYRVRVHGKVNEKRLASLKNGLTWNGVRYGSIDARLEKKQDSANAWLTISLTEGKNREVRYVMEALGLSVNRLIRMSYGPFTLDELERGGLLEVHTDVMKKVLPPDLVKRIF